MSRNSLFFDILAKYLFKQPPSCLAFIHDHPHVIFSRKKIFTCDADSFERKKERQSISIYTKKNLRGCQGGWKLNKNVCESEDEVLFLTARQIIVRLSTNFFMSH